MRKASTAVWVRRAAKATQRGACWQLLSSEESHEASSKGLQALVEGFECPFTADGVAEEHRDKVDELGSWVGIAAHQPPSSREALPPPSPLIPIRILNGNIEMRKAG